MSNDQDFRAAIAAQLKAGRTISGLPDPLWPSAALSLRDLARPAPNALPQQRPQGPLRDHVGARIRRQLDADHHTDEELAAAERLTAWPVLPLQGAALVAQSLASISEAVRDLLARTLPGIDWWVPQHWSGPFRKYGILHNSLPAPPNPATGEAMAIEVYGLAECALEPGTRPWFDQLEQRLRRGDSDEVQAVTLPTRIRISVATYSNLMYPGFGVPLYM